MDKPLSANEIMDIIGYRVNIASYDDIQQYNKIEDLLADNECCLILYNYGDIHDKIQLGHWCVIFTRLENDKPIIEFFDPYGFQIDTQIDYIKDYYKEKNMYLYPWLSKLLLAADNRYDLHYNNYKLQRDADDILTCGYWVAIRVVCRDRTIDKFWNYYNQFDDKDEQVVIDSNIIRYLDNI